MYKKSKTYRRKQSWRALSLLAGILFAALLTACSSQAAAVPQQQPVRATPSTRQTITITAIDYTLPHA